MVTEDYSFLTALNIMILSVRVVDSLDTLPQFVGVLFLDTQKSKRKIKWEILNIKTHIRFG